MRRSFHRADRRLVVLVGDAAALTIAVLLALWTWSLTAGFPFNATFVRGHLIWFFAVALWLLLLIPTRQARVALDLTETAVGLLKAAGILLLLYLAAFFYIRGEILPRLVALYLLWDATLLVFAWRVVAQWSFMQAPFTRRILLVGDGEPLSTARTVIADPSFRDARVVGVATANGASPPGDLPVVGSATDVDEIARRLMVTDVVVALDGKSGDPEPRWVQRLLRCQESGADVIRMPQLYEDTFHRVPVEHVEPTWLLTNFFDVARFRQTSPLAKRALDLAVASMLAVIGVVLAPIIAVAILIESGRPIFYRQERLGRGGRPFSITKFRTMRHDAESDGQARWSTPGDPRVTRVGRVLRRMRLDELPNLWAVLRGEMSMVGPRPERPEFIERLEREVPLYRARLVVPPGLTGWAQVNTPYGDSVADATTKLEYDLYYIKHHSMWFDALILLRTVGTIFRFGGQ